MTSQAIGFSVGVLLSLPLAGCGGSSTETHAVHATAGWFAEVGPKLGINFVHDAGPAHEYFMPQSIGSGVALFDCDGDGRLDIYLLQNGGPRSSSRNRLFRQDHDGRFRDASPGSGLDIAGYCMGAAAGDVNNDGRVDLLVTEFGRLRLFLNEGGCHFVDVTDAAGLHSPLWGTSAAFFDYDRDGWLDLVVVSYVDYDPGRPCTSTNGRPDFCAPKEFEGSVAKLFHNVGSLMQGDSQARVRFADRTLESGLGLLPGPGLGVLPADFNGDRWPDIFVANDGQPNRLWINQHDGTFREEATQRGVAYNALGTAEANMGIAYGDVDGDGAPDLFVTHLTDETHTLWKQQSAGVFQDRTVASGLTKLQIRGTGFGTVLADFDCDGDLDLAIANGRVSRSPSVTGNRDSAFWADYFEENQVAANDGFGNFHDVSISNPDLCATPAVARGMACGDLDNDGALDLVVTNIADRARICRNVAAHRGHWLLIQAMDPELNRDAYGAEITIVTAGRRQRRLIQPAYSYLCSNDPRAHFGLGTSAEIESLEVIWPDGSEEVFGEQKSDQLLVLKKGSGEQVDRKSIEGAQP